MDKDIKLLDDFFILCKRFIFVALALIVTLFCLNYLLLSNGEELNPIASPHSTECDCVRLIVDDMRKENMIFLQIEETDKEVWEFIRRYENGEETKYIHQWK